MRKRRKLSFAVISLRKLVGHAAGKQRHSCACHRYQDSSIRCALRPTRTIVRSLADSAPSTLATMHGSSFSGDAAAALRGWLRTTKPRQRPLSASRSNQCRLWVNSGVYRQHVRSFSPPLHVTNSCHEIPKPDLVTGVHGARTENASPNLVKSAPLGVRKSTLRGRRLPAPLVGFQLFHL